MAMDATIDARMRAALARLTDNEKECLRRRLQQQTAKEMALELGVSPHAVEKRLKMARTKLGLSSSLEAARLLQASETYQQTGPKPSVLHDLVPSGEARLPRPTVIGALAMILATAATLALYFQSSGTPLEGGVVPYPGPSGVAQVPATQSPARTEGPAARVLSPAEAAQPIIWGEPITGGEDDPNQLVPATPAEVGIIVRDTFTITDRNRSGFIEPDETLANERRAVIESKIYERDTVGNVRETGKVRRVTLEEARAEQIAQADENDDGKLDFQEFSDWMKPVIAKRGIPAKWKADINRLDL